MSITDEQIDGWWDIARPGVWKGTVAGSAAPVEISGEDIEQMAADYDCELMQAPVVVEHRRQGPAHGWVKELRVAGGRLQARLAGISEELRQWLRSGAYRSRSIEMYRPFEQTGRAYLGALSFLGAAAPAVKGLSPTPSLMREQALEDGVLTVETAGMEQHSAGKGDEWMDDRTIAERAMKALREMFSAGGNAGADNGGARVSTVDSEETAALREELSREREARQAAERELEKLAGEARARESEQALAAFAEALDKAAGEGRITPAELKGYYRLGSRLDETGRGAILEEVGAREPLALFGELSAPEDKGRRAASDAVPRSAFEGFPEDPEHDAALELMAAEPGLSFSEAVRRVRANGRG